MSARLAVLARPLQRAAALALVALAVGLALPARAGAETVSPELAAEITQLEQYLATHPDDPSAMCVLGFDRARAGQTDAALGLFERVARGRSGLDPSGLPRKPIAGVADSPRFQALVAAIRRAHPPQRRNRLAYTLAERDLIPEGIAWDPVGRAFYIGSLAKRKIVRLDADGSVHTFKAPRADGLGSVLGLAVDARRRTLWAVNDVPADEGGGRSAVYQYDLRTGALRFRHALPAGNGSLLNDVALTAAGEAYVTDTNHGTVYRLSPERDGLEPLLPTGTLGQPNGLALAPGGRWLFVATWLGVERVDLHSGEHQPLVVPAGLSIANLDGLYFHRGTLVGIQNGLHPGRVLRLRLDPALEAVRAVEVLDSYDPSFDIPTTGAFDGDTFYFLGNTQLDRLGPRNAPPPPEGLQGVRVHALTVH